MAADPLVRVCRAADKAALAREQFEEAIRFAAQTRSVRQIAEVAGLSASRVHQILHGR